MWDQTWKDRRIDTKENELMPVCYKILAANLDCISETVIDFECNFVIVSKLNRKYIIHKWLQSVLNIGLRFSVLFLGKGQSQRVVRLRWTGASSVLAKDYEIYGPLRVVNIEYNDMVSSRFSSDQELSSRQYY